MATLIPTFALAQHLGERVELEASTIGELIDEAKARWGTSFVEALKTSALLVNGRSVNYLEGRNTPLETDDVVWMVRPASGG